MGVFHQCLAFGPVAVYLVLLGVMNLSRRPRLVSGARDAAALGLALSGMVIIGPLALFFPDSSALRMGPHGTKLVWALLTVLYGLGLVSLLLLARPRLVIYNVSADRLRPILARVVERLDPDTRWAGDSLVLPAFGVQMHVERAAWMRNVCLVSAGSRQEEEGWRRLGTALGAVLAEVEVPRNPRGVTFLAVGVFLARACPFGASLPIPRPWPAHSSSCCNSNSPLICLRHPGG